MASILHKLFVLYCAGGGAGMDDGGASHGASILLESGSYLLQEDGTSSFLLQ